MNNRYLVIVSGLPGSGKSSLAEAIATQLKLPLFSVDPIESSILKSGIARTFETGLAAYLVVEALAAEQLKIGLSVVIDAVSPVRAAREMWQRLSERYQARLLIIECVVEPELHQKRIESRVRNLHGIPEVTWDDVQAAREGYVPWEVKRLIVDTANHIDDSLEKCLKYIQSE